MKYALLFFLLTSVNAQDEGFMLGGYVGISNSSQDDLNTLRTRANLRTGGITAEDLTDGWEFSALMQWRWSYFGLQLRPSLFSSGTEGSGSDGNYEYSVTGKSITTMFKLYPLENDVLRLFFQAGVSWASMTTKIQEAEFKIEATGTNIGYVVGAGIELVYGSHIFILEGGARFLLIERSLIDATSGTPADDSITQTQLGSELEYDNQDLGVNMSGIQTLLGYAYQF